jgi:hypothetical protein
MLTIKQLSANIRKISKSAEKFATDVQEALIVCAYYAMKDGNTTPLNDLMDAVGDGTRLKGFTAWAELFAPVRIKEGRFVLNKGAAKDIHVTCPEDFAEFEAEMRTVRWDKIVEKEPVESIWDASKALDKFYKRLEQHGDIELAAALRKAELEFRIKQNAILPMGQEAA